MRHIITPVAYLTSMKKTINGVLVVEGHNDVSYISSLYEGIFVVTNGYQIPNEEIDFLNHLPENTNIYILTDSDEAGKQIRNKLDDLVKNKTHIVLDITKCNKNGKHGVAECEKDELIKVLDQYTGEASLNNNLTTSDLLSLGIDNKMKREYLCQMLHLGVCNNKTLLKRINYLKIKETRIREVMEKYGN